MKKGAALLFIGIALTLGCFAYETILKRETLPTDATLDARVGNLEYLILSSRFAKADTAFEAARVALSNTSWDYPLGQLVTKVVGSHNTAFPTRLDAWVNEEPDSVAARVMRAQYYFIVAWNVRGDGFVKDIPSNTMKEYESDMRTGYNDLQVAFQKDRSLPLVYLLMLEGAGNIGTQKDQNTIFNYAIAKFPSFYPLYIKRLSFLAPKWGGSVSAIVSFVNQYAGTAPNSSPLKMLYIDAYFSLIQDMELNCDHYESSRKDYCRTSTGAILNSASMQTGVKEALALSSPGNTYAFHRKFTEAASNCDCVRDSPYTKALLDTAQSIWGSDSYTLNYMLGSYYSHLRAYADARKYYEKALDEFKRAKFPSDQERLSSLNTIYSALEDSAHDQNDISAMYYYASQKVLMGFPQKGLPYYSLMCGNVHGVIPAWKELAEDCTTAIDLQHQKGVAYPYDLLNRAYAYYMLSRFSDAERDIETYIKGQPVGSGDSGNYSGPVFDLVKIYNAEHNYEKSIDLLNRVPDLFNPKINASNAATAYYQRCDTYESLSNYVMAAKDCDMAYMLLPNHMMAAKKEEIAKLAAGKAR